MCPCSCGVSCTRRGTECVPASPRAGRVTSAACALSAVVGLLAVGCGQGATSPSARAATTTTAWFGPRVGADALATTWIGGAGGDDARCPLPLDLEWECLGSSILRGRHPQRQCR